MKMFKDGTDRNKNDSMNAYFENKQTSKFFTLRKFAQKEKEDCVAPIFQLDSNINFWHQWIKLNNMTGLKITIHKLGFCLGSNPDY